MFFDPIIYFGPYIFYKEKNYLSNCCLHLLHKNQGRTTNFVNSRFGAVVWDFYDTHCDQLTRKKIHKLFVLRDRLRPNIELFGILFESKSQWVYRKKTDIWKIKIYDHVVMFEWYSPVKNLKTILTCSKN